MKTLKFAAGALGVGGSDSFCEQGAALQRRNGL